MACPRQDVLNNVNAGSVHAAIPRDTVRRHYGGVRRGLGGVQVEKYGLLRDIRCHNLAWRRKCKAYLQLDNETYVAIRKAYTAICEEMGILKKTECADGMWEESKRRLINESPHLSAVMNELDPEFDKRQIALECLAADVTKRMRVTGRAITIADANNILGLNPT